MDTGRSKMLPEISRNWRKVLFRRYNLYVEKRIDGRFILLMFCTVKRRGDSANPFRRQQFQMQARRIYQPEREFSLPNQGFLADQLILVHLHGMLRTSRPDCTTVRPFFLSNLSTALGETHEKRRKQHRLESLSHCDEQQSLFQDFRR